MNVEQPEAARGVGSSDNQGKKISGVFERDDRGGGFLRQVATNYAVAATDPRVSSEVARRFGLRGGELVQGAAKPASGSTRAVELAAVELVNDLDAQAYFDVKPFEDLTAIDPHVPLRFETKGGPLSMRVVDLLTPIGLGQRGLIVAPPRSGKTILLQQMAHGIAANHPDVYMMVLLVDERPEEVTEMRRTVHGEVVASCNDRDVASHVRICRLMIDRARRLVECRRHVVILLDSLTRVGRAFNAAVRSSGRIMSGGLDIRALTEPKAIFGSARTVEHGGSLTIIASALIETGSRMDDVIFNEFKGTGNMEIMLSREMANRRVWPAIDLSLSGTRKEERLLSPPALQVAYKIRRSLVEKDPGRSMEQLLDALGKFPDNAGFVANYSDRTLR